MVFRNGRRMREVVGRRTVLMLGPEAFEEDEAPSWAAPACACRGRLEIGGEAELILKGLSLEAMREGAFGSARSMLDLLRKL